VSQVVGVDGIRAALDDFSAEHPDLAIRYEDPALKPQHPGEGKHD
jgi:hypothetical protein